MGNDTQHAILGHRIFNHWGYRGGIENAKKKERRCKLI